MFLESQHATSQLRAVVETSGAATWLYLLDSESNEPIADAFLYCSAFAASAAEIETMMLAGEPPAILQELATELALRPLVTEAELELMWNRDGDAVAVCINDQVIAFASPELEMSYSKALAKVSSFGSPWDQDVFTLVFPT